MICFENDYPDIQISSDSIQEYKYSQNSNVNDLYQL